MAYSTERDTIGRNSFTRVEVDFPTCALTYGNAPCTASGGSGAECRNTNNTCQDLSNYDGSTTKTIEFCDTNISIPGYPMHPQLESAKHYPTKNVKDQALGKRAQITLTFRDEGTQNFVDDADIDPYWANRTGTAQGSFWRKLKAIFKYYNGAALRVKTTYINSTYDPTDSVTRNYILDEIQGPDKNGQVTLVALDVLKLADDKRSKYPVATTGTLATALTAASTSSFTLTGGAGQYADAGGYIRIGDEVIQYTSGSDSGSDNSIAGTITRGGYNTTAATHAIGDTAQKCIELSNTNIVDFLDTLLFTAAGISSGYKDTTTWTAAQDNWFASTNLNGLITEAEGVTSLIEDLQHNHALFYIWWDEINQKIKLKAIAPADTVTASLTDTANILEVNNVKELPESRITRSIVYFGPLSPIDTSDPSDYKSVYVHIDADAETAAQYGDERIVIAYARFFTSEGLAVQFGGRRISRFRDPPKSINLIVDAQDTASLWTGDLANVSTRYLQDVDGSNLSTLMQIFSAQELTDKAAGTHYKFEMVDTVYHGRYARIMSAAASSVYYSATAAEKASGGYIYGSGGSDFSDGGGAYKTV